MFKLILHNVFKHKFLFLLIGAMIVLLVFYLIVGLNTLFSVSESLKTALADNLTGTVIVTSAEVKRMDVITKDGEKKLIVMPDWQEVLADLRQNPLVANASPRLRVTGLLKSEYNSMGFILVGVDPASEPELLPNRSLIEGRWLSASNEMNLYFRHSDYMSVTNGEELGLGALTVDGSFNYAAAKLVGIVDYKDLSFYMDYAFYAFLPLDYLNRLILTPSPAATEICVRLNDPSALGKFEKGFAKKYGKTYRFVEPQNASNLTSGIYKLTYFSVCFVAFLLVLLVFLCSSFLVSLSIENRRQEIGIYRALGVPNWRIGSLFGGEFMTVVTAFGIAGTALGLAAMRFVSREGIRATIIPLQLIFGRRVLTVANHEASFVIVFAILLLAFIGSVVYTVLQLGKFDPVEVMREL